MLTDPGVPAGLCATEQCAHDFRDGAGCGGGAMRGSSPVELLQEQEEQGSYAEGWCHPSAGQAAEVHTRGHAHPGGGDLARMCLRGQLVMMQ